MKKLALILVALSLLVAACAAEDDVSDPVTESQAPIINGTASTDTTVGAIYYYNLNDIGHIYPHLFCSGVLLSSTRVLTAAHCFDYLLPNNIYFSTSATLNVFTPGFAEQRVTQSTARHPGYDATTGANDLIILTLQTASPSPYGKLPTRHENAAMNNGNTATLVGYGQDNGGAAGARKQGNNTVNVLATATFNTGPATGGANGCYGDSGGAARIAFGGVSKVAGIISSAQGTGCTNGTVSERLGYYLTWIMSVFTLPCDSGVPCGSGRICGDGICHTDEDYTTCPADCQSPTYCVEGTYYANGQTHPFTSGNPIHPGGTITISMNCHGNSYNWYLVGGSCSGYSTTFHGYQQTCNLPSGNVTIRVATGTLSTANLTFFVN
jgi:hypothetical protein